MRPLMLLLVSGPLLIGALALVAAQTSVRELLLPPPAQWTWAHKVRAAGFASDCEHTLTIAAWTVVDDSGRSVNPMIVHGQMHGAAAQGIGPRRSPSGASMTRPADSC
jgi:hypothetical protein